MTGHPIPWYEALAMLVEITDGGDIIQPVLPGVLPITLPQFGLDPGTEGRIPTGWAKYEPLGTHVDAKYYESGAALRYAAVRQFTGSMNATGRHGWITTAFYNVTAGHMLRLSMSGYRTKAASTGFLRIEGYNATTTVIQASWEVVVSPSGWALVSLDAGPIPAGVTRVRVMMGNIFVVGDSGMQFRDPIMWDDPLTPGQLPLEPLTWRDITCDVQSTTIRYGRERLTDRFDVGTFSLVLRNADGEYAYARPHPDRFGPGALIRISAIHNGNTYPMAYGVLDSVVEDTDLEGKNIVVLTAYDPTTLWASINWRLTYGISSGSGELSGARINRLLDFVSYLARSVDAGTITMQALPAVSGRPLRDDAGITADTEGGAVFAERNGSIVFRDATWRAVESYAQNVMANITAQDDGASHTGFDYLPDDENAPELCPHELVTDWSLRRLINRVALANAGGTAQTFDRLASQRLYGVRGYQRLDYIGTSDGYLAARAESLLSKYDQPKLRVNAVTYRPALAGSDEAWSFTLQVFFNWLVRVWYRNPLDEWGYVIAAYVQGIEHRITPTDWVTTLRLDDPATFAHTSDGHYAVWSIAGSDRAIWDESLWDGVTWDIPGERFVATWDESVWT